MSNRLSKESKRDRWEEVNELVVRDLVDYKELKSLSTDDVLNLQDRIDNKLEEIEDSIDNVSRYRMMTLLNKDRVNF